MEQSPFYRTDDIMLLLDIKESTAYKVIASLNRELEEKGFLTFSGRVPKRYFLERYGCYFEDDLGERS